MEVVEPWASMYVNSIREKRFGDTVWARYRISGDVTDGIKEGTNQTVRQIIEEDARGYRANEPDLYTKALSFYAQTSSADTLATDVVDLIKRIGEEDVTQIQKRKTYETSCITNWLAYEASCY